MVTLQDISDRDAKILATKDYKNLDFDYCRYVIESNDLSLFTRSPDQLRHYLAAKKRLTQDHGSVANFIVSQRLQLADQLRSTSGKGYLEDPSDIKILVNDYPYGLEDNITHLCVWTKVRCPTSGDERPTKEAHEKITKYVNATFGALGIPPEDLLWFKNTAALQSVPSLEHFHVLIRNGPQAKELEGTSGVVV